jgi:3-hydroxyacyl-CoA dehydrogenase/enoyl-CoA hydratase/3-hydroxybutyryl-CoA epimerase
MIAVKLTGRASGRGFYHYPERRPNNELLSMRAIHRPTHRSPAELAERMSLLLVNEAARCIEEQIVRSANDLDLAAVLGAGFAPFRGGPLRYADDCGLPNVVAALERLAAEDARFLPCQLVRTLAAKEGSFYSDSSTRTRL